MLTAALSYVARGWAVIPLRPGGKEPFTDLLPTDRFGESSWKMLDFQPATALEVQKWFRLQPDINIGIIARDGLVIVDVDRQPTKPLHLPPTVSASSGRGAHYYYRSAQPLKSRKFSWGDLKADGGYIVAPPSLHPNGSRYEWADFCGPDSQEVAELPLSLLEEEPQRKPLQETRAGQVSEINIYLAYPEPASGESTIREWACREDVATAIMRLCGVPNPRLEKGFCCVLPGHEECKPSAALHRMEDGMIQYHDFHAKSGPAWFTPAEVYFARKTGKVRKLSPGENAIWLLRALVEAGFMRPPAMMAPKLPATVKPIIATVYQGFRDLLAIRMLYNPTQTATPFSWTFAAEWCGRSERHCGEAITWLIDAGYLQRAGQVHGKRKMALFAIGSPREDGGNRD